MLPATEDFDTMGAFIQELVDAGVLLAADGLQPSAKGARIYFDGAALAPAAGPRPDHRRDRPGLPGAGALRNYHLLPSVRGDFLVRPGRHAEARAEFERGASLTATSGNGSCC